MTATTRRSSTGLKSSVDAERLADELAFAATRLRVLEFEPPGLYAEVASPGEIEERSWLAFLIAYLCPLDSDDPFATIARVRTSWASGADARSRRRGAWAPHRPRAAAAGCARSTRTGPGRRVRARRRRRSGASRRGRRSAGSRACSSGSRFPVCTATRASTCSSRSAGSACYELQRRSAAAGRRQRGHGRRQARARDRRLAAARAARGRARGGVRGAARGARSRPLQLGRGRAGDARARRSIASLTRTARIGSRRAWVVAGWVEYGAERRPSGGLRCVLVQSSLLACIGAMAIGVLLASTAAGLHVSSARGRSSALSRAIRSRPVLRSPDRSPTRFQDAVRRRGGVRAAAVDAHVLRDPANAGSKLKLSGG